VPSLTLLVRSPSLAAAADAARRTVDASGLLQVTSVSSLRERIDRTLGQDRLLAVLSGSFAWLALLLAAIGLYGVMAYTAARRTGEIGLRMALGASRSDIIWLVLRETLWLVLIGLAIGIPAAMVATRGIASLLFGVDSHEYAMLGIGVAVMVGAACLAAVLPVRKAMTVQPARALRLD
jgi:ABC-type antimicrobial peptide transport system permease subunit